MRAVRGGKAGETVFTGFAAVVILVLMHHLVPNHALPRAGLLQSVLRRVFIQEPAMTNATSPTAPLTTFASPMSPPQLTPRPPTQPCSSCSELSGISTTHYSISGKAIFEARSRRRSDMTRREKCWGFWVWVGLGGI